MTPEEAASKLRYKMSRIRGKETKPEIKVRSLLHRSGFRFRKHVRGLPGKPDIVLRKHNAVIFVNGCFWHQHRGCPKCKIPKSRVEFWTAKLRENVRRDQRDRLTLEHQGWRVFVVWECEVRDEAQLRTRLELFLHNLSQG